MNKCESKAQGYLTQCNSLFGSDDPVGLSIPLSVGSGAIEIALFLRMTSFAGSVCFTSKSYFKLKSKVGFTSPTVAGWLHSSAALHERPREQL